VWLAGEATSSRLVLANTTPTSGVATMSKDTAAMIINILERSNLAIFFRSSLLFISATPFWDCSLWPY
jgi:hypothetical protein